MPQVDEALSLTRIPAALYDPGWGVVTPAHVDRTCRVYMPRNPGLSAIFLRSESLHSCFVQQYDSSHGRTCGGSASDGNVHAA